VKPLTYADLRDWWGGERFRAMASAAGKTEALIAAAAAKLKAAPADPEALVPLVIAAVSILTTFLLVLGLTVLTPVSFIVQFLISLVGLGVAIDYSLLLVSRWREERAHGHDNRTAVVIAMRTAGHAVLASGVTVAISLLALLVVPVPFLRSMGLGGLLIPLVSVAAVLTLLPAVLSSIGPRLDWPRIRQEGSPLAAGRRGRAPSCAGADSRPVPPWWCWACSPPRCSTCASANPASIPWPAAGPPSTPSLNSARAGWVPACSPPSRCWCPPTGPKSRWLRLAAWKACAPPSWAAPGAPLGVRRRAHRRDRVLAAGDHLRVPVRAVHGLRGVHPRQDA